MTDALDPSLFIGCSSEANSVAQALQAELDTVCEPTLWYQGVFGATTVTMTALLEEAQRVDYAVLVLTPDDIKISRGQTSASARDNAILELRTLPWFNWSGPGVCGRAERRRSSTSL